MIPLPYRILIAVVVCLGIFVAGYFVGETNAVNAADAQKGKALQTSVNLHAKAESAGNEAERVAVAREGKTAEVFSGIQQKVVTYAQTHPASSDCLLDADGLRLWRAANAGADAESASGSDDGVSSSASTSERADDGSAGEPHSGGQEVPRVQGPALGSGGLAKQDQ